MNRMRGLAAGLGVAALMVIGAACGGGNDEPPASADFDAPPAADPSGTSVAPPAPAGVPTPKETSATNEPAPSSQGRENISCFPTGLVARVGASVGDSWTLAGDIRLQGKIPGPPNELRDRSAESSVTFTLTGLDDGGMNRVVDEATGKRARIENSVAYAHITTVYRDDEGTKIGLQSSTATTRRC